MAEDEILLAPLQERRLGPALERILRSLQYSKVISYNSSSIASPGEMSIPDLQARITEKRVLFHRLIRSLQLEYGYEGSFKLTHGQLLGDRFLIGIDKKDVSSVQVQEVCKQMQMPVAYQKEFLHQRSAANVLGFGFEATATHCFYKAYLEFWDRIQRKLADQPGQDPQILFLGYKWNVMQPEQAVTSTYLYYPALSVAEILQRIATLYGPHPPVSYHWIVSLLQQANQRITSGSFVYVEVSEEQNSRKSFDLNLYRANLTVRDIYPLLEQLCQHYGIPSSQFAPFYRAIEQRPVGHISGGYDRTGRDFITLYYEIEALPG